MSAKETGKPPLGFGIVGLGLIANFHERAIAEAGGARLAGVADTIEAKARSSPRQRARRSGRPGSRNWSRVPTSM